MLECKRYRNCSVQMRVADRTSRTFTENHRLIVRDLFALATSRYKEVSGWYICDETFASLAIFFYTPYFIITIITRQIVFFS